MYKLGFSNLSVIVALFSVFILCEDVPYMDSPVFIEVKHIIGSDVITRKLAFTNGDLSDEASLSNRSLKFCEEIMGENFLDSFEKMDWLSTCSQRIVDHLKSLNILPSGSPDSQVEELTKPLDTFRTDDETKNYEVKINSKEKGILSVNVGRGTYGHDSISFLLPESTLVLSEVNITIGRYCSIAPQVSIDFRNISTCAISEEVETTISRYQFSKIFPGKVRGNRAQKPRISRSCTIHPNQGVLIGHDVWIGFGARIMSGVRIGNGAVLGTRSIVHDDVEAYSIVVGDPARHYKYRFPSQRLREELQASEWWEWEVADIVRNMEFIIGNDTEGFVRQARTVNSKRKAELE